MMNKAQASQTFIYLAAVIVVGAIMLLGYQGISEVLDRGCEVQKQTFTDELVMFLQESTRRGTIKTYNEMPPCDIQEVCFVDQENDSLEDAEDNGDYPGIIRDDISAGVPNTVYMREGNLFTDISQFAGIRLDSKAVACFNASQTGRITFSTEGLGRGRVEITE